MVPRGVRGAPIGSGRGGAGLYSRCLFTPGCDGASSSRLSEGRRLPDGYPLGDAFEERPQSSGPDELPGALRPHGRCASGPRTRRSRFARRPDARTGFPPRPSSEPARPFVRRAGMRIACQGILGTRIGTPSRPGWSWPESISGRSGAWRRADFQHGRSVQPPRSGISQGGGGSGSRGWGVVPWNYPETSPGRWHRLVPVARRDTSN
jgi:hypothetical protein